MVLPSQNDLPYILTSFVLCFAGIQQYLFENGRIDNIFTDNYFDKFTEFLNEVLTMYEPKLNTAGKAAIFQLNPIAPRKAKIVCNFGLSEWNRVKNCMQFWPF